MRLHADHLSSTFDALAPQLAPAAGPAGVAGTLPPLEPTLLLGPDADAAHPSGAGSSAALLTPLAPPPQLEPGAPAANLPNGRCSDAAPNAHHRPGGGVAPFGTPCAPIPDGDGPAWPPEPARVAPRTGAPLLDWAARRLYSKLARVAPHLPCSRRAQDVPLSLSALRHPTPGAGTGATLISDALLSPALDVLRAGSLVVNHWRRDAAYGFGFLSSYVRPGNLTDDLLMAVLDWAGFLLETPAITLSPPPPAGAVPLSSRPGAFLRAAPAVGGGAAGAERGPRHNA